MTSTNSEEKQPNWKGQSRTLRICHWCTKKQEPGVKPFQACSRCKEVIYCSKQCQVASWPFHKTPCKASTEFKQSVSGRPELAQSIGIFKKWHASHVDLLRHAAVCALDLGNTPANADTKLLLIQFELKPNHADLPYQDKYFPVGGFDLTMDEARSMLGGMPNGIQLLEQSKENHEFMKKKGGLGIATLLLMANKMVDLTRVVLPSQETARTMQRVDDWGQNWVNMLAQRLEMSTNTK